MSDLILRRLAYRRDGIFSALLLDGAPRFVTLEHAFDGGSMAPIIPPGEYTCQRGTHKLENDPKRFVTYAVEGVAGHSGLVFHWGNTNSDTKGCVLLGLQTGFLAGDVLEVLNSRLAFSQFMAWAKGRPTLSLTVLT